MLCVDLQASERAREMCTYTYVARRMMTFEALRAWQIRERENELIKLHILPPTYLETFHADCSCFISSQQQYAMNI